jgi:hypothetical protein
MEPDVQPAKSHSDVISSERSGRRKEEDPMSDLDNDVKQEPQMTMTMHSSTASEEGQDISAMAEASSQNHSEHARVDAMKSHISMSRAITVELNTLRDMMPKLRREIHTYSMNECQLVKELEKQLPECHEHKDVRLNLVLAEIQRLRINKRRALRRLRDSQVRAVELECSMESSSYEAGELFWDSKISTLSRGDYSARLNVVATAIIEEKRAKENSSFAPVTRSASHEASSSESNMMTPGATQSNALGRKNVQGYFIESTRNAPMYRVQPKAFEVKNQTMAGTSARVTPNENSSLSEANVASTETTHENSSQSRTSSLNLHEQAARRTGHLDLEKMVTEARRKEQHRSFTFKRFGLLIAVLPVSTVVGLLLLDWQTGFMSWLFSPILGK